MADTKAKPKSRHPRPTSRQAKNPDTPRKSDKGVPDDMERRYRAGEQGAGSTSIGDEIDQSYEDGRKAGAKEASTSAPAAPSTTTTAPATPGNPRLRDTSSRLSIGAPLAVETVLITVNTFTHDHRPPLPSQLLVAFAFFGLLGLASGDAAAPASALGWGIVLATFYSGTGSTSSPPAIGALSTLGKFFGGQYKAKGSLTTGASSSVASTQEAGSTGVRLA